MRKCPKVKITASSANPYLKVINNDIYSKNGKVLYSVASTKTKYKVRKSVKEIEDGAFYKNDSIKSIYLPDSVKEIGEEAFGDMENLQSIRFSRSISELDYAMFNKCKKLNSQASKKNSDDSRKSANAVQGHVQRIRRDRLAQPPCRRLQRAAGARLDHAGAPAPA